MQKRKRPIICFNASTNVVGGAVQNSANFMQCAQNDPDIDWCYVVSSKVLSEARKIGFSGDVLCLDESPAHSSISRRKLFQFAVDTEALAVYTMAGPAYVDFPCIHFMGCSNPYLTNLSWQSLTYSRNVSQVIVTFARSVYQAFHARKADYWIFQTESSRKGFVRRLLIPQEHTYVVPNAVGKAFDLCRFDAERPDMSKNTVRGIYPAAYYPHKAHMLIPDVLSELSRVRPDLNIKLSVTLKKGSKAEKSLFALAKQKNVEQRLDNIGTYSYSDAPAVLASHDFVFFPSILEVFSTSYLEAMAASRPLVVSDKGFAREVCDRFAFYFRPLSAKDAADKIVSMVESSRSHSLCSGDFRSQEQTIPLLEYDERYHRIKQLLLSKIP